MHWRVKVSQLHIPLQTTDSTNEHAKRLIDASFSAPFCLTAVSQTAGRGQYNRRWQSLTGNYHGSFVIKGNVSPFLAAVATYKTITKYNEYSLTKIKWPNDIYLNHKKVAGILTEVYKGHTIIGIGINCFQKPENEHTTNFQFAVSSVSVHNSLLDYLSCVNKVNERSLYLKNLLWLGQVVQLKYADNIYCGSLQTVNAHGGVVINGQPFYSGQLSLHE